MLTDRTETDIASRMTFNNPQGPPPRIAIAIELAKLEGIPQSQTNFTLADEVDPDALDDLVTDDAHNTMVAFTVNNYHLVVQSDGRV